MKINLSKQSYYLGEPILVDIEYANTSTAEITIADPQESFDVEIHFLDTSTREDLTYTMGQVEPIVMESHQWALGTPVPKDISIAPHSSYSFMSNANDRLYLRPGKFEVFVTDSGAESARVDVTILLNKQSLTHLSTVAMAKEESYSRREWAMTNVQTAYPEFKLKLAYDNKNQAMLDEYEKYNQLKYQTFLEWLSKQDNIPAS